MTETHRIVATVHGRYLVEAPREPAGRPVVVGFHGYGENASRHLEALRGLPVAADCVLCAVQGLHPFYNTKTGEVVASWMTSQDRELAIADNVRYTAGVVEALRGELGVDGPLVYAGFSQGVAMTWRAAVLAGHPAAGVIALAGDFPPELAGEDLSLLPPVLIGRGKADTWYDEAKMAQDLERLEAGGVEVTTCVFEGGHEWTAAFYAACGSYLERLSR